MNGNYNFGRSFNPSDFNVSLPGLPTPSFDPMSLLFNLGGTVVGQGLSMLNQHMQWNKQEEFYNKYQSPMAQMRQFAEAGINPNAAAAGIAGNGAGQTMTPATQSQTAGISGELAGILGNSYNSALNASNLREQTEQIHAATRDLAASAEGKEIENAMKKIELGLKPDLSQAELEEKQNSAKLLGEQIDNAKKERDKIQKEIDVLKEQKDTIVAERGLVEYDKQLKATQAALNNATAALNAILASVNENDPEYQYALAVKKHGAGSEQAKAALKAITDREEGVAQANAQGKMNVEYGHTGMVAETIDAVRRFVGTHQNYGINEVLQGFGISFDKNGLPHFSPIDKLFNRITRPSYDTWRKEMNNQLRNKIALLQNDYRTGKISKDEYREVRKGLDDMLNSLTKDAYNKTFGIK